MREANATIECGCASPSRQMEGLADMENNRAAIFQSSIMACGDTAEVAWKVKLAFKKMPGEMALTCFAKAMTVDLPHPIKVAVWDSVRYSHIWWGVDEVLKGSVMEDPVVQLAFADAVPMRKWIVDNRLNNWDDITMTLDPQTVFHSPHVQTELHRLIFLCTHFADVDASEALRTIPSSCDLARVLADFVDWRGNGILWYLTYRDDQNARGGFACPRIERELLRLGADPNLRNNIGLCWNDVRRQLIRVDM